MHPISPPRDVVYDYVLPEEQENLLEDGDSGDFRKQVQKSFFGKYKDLYRIITLLEGNTGHRVISFKDLDFEMLPTKRGLEIFDKFREVIPVMLSSLSEEELEAVFKEFGDELFTWDFVEPQLREGVEDGFLKPIDYVAEEGKTGSKDEFDREYIERSNEARRFRFLAQGFAQKAKAGIRWRVLRKKSEALQQLAELENVSVAEIIKKYGV